MGKRMTHGMKRFMAITMLALMFPVFIALGIMGVMLENTLGKRN
jgi:hypothetical protein